MKVFKNRKLSLIIAVVIILSVVAFLSLKDSVLDSKKTVKILDYSLSVCTMNVPSSSCGPYEVSTQSVHGDKFTYKVAGFNNTKSERYDDITSRLAKAKQENTTVTLKLDNNDYVIAVE